ncbi:hypothetical protein JTB14_006982 [Gonioctena quinquepunctata]|nr:hypothetical protein JTB14_006982 [Gonioctena quinquepunctata]
MKPRSSNKNTESQKKCTRCGYDWHDKLTNCTAKNAKCGFCEFEGHYSKMCYRKEKPKNKNVQAVEEESENDDEECYVHEIKAKDDYNAWTQELRVICEGKTLEPIKFKLDTAADVTMLPLNVLKDIIAELPLGKSKNKVFSAKKRDRFNTLGTLTMKLKYKNKETIEIAFVSCDMVLVLLSLD